MNCSPSKLVFAAAGLLPFIGLTGCVVHTRDRVVVEERRPREVIVEERRPREVFIEERIPEPRVERRSIRPSDEHIWIDGHYVREGNHWDWVSGRWERRPRHDAVWFPGHHEQREHGYVWIEGRWR